MPELLLEVGTEELPASFVERAYTDLRDHLGAALAAAGVLAEAGIALGTPRRLIISFPNVIDRQADSVKESRGPALKAAYDASGSPTPALLGFCRGQGVDVDSITSDGTYVWAKKEVAGRLTSDLLPEILPAAIRQLTFSKSMRWGSSRMRFARPIRWLLALYGSQVVNFEIEGVTAGAESYGHRFYSPAGFTVQSFDSLLGSLRDRMVEPDAEIRRSKIIADAKSAATGSPDLSADLVDENTFLTEWPTAIEGRFREEYLLLPSPVLVTAMAKHEKMFPVHDSVGNLTNRFVFIRNSGQDNEVRKGCEWVLNARFNDAKFFFDEDRKHSLDHFLAQTDRIVFQQKLGTVRQRADRIEAVSQYVAEQSGASTQVAQYARAAGRLSKADLSSGLVGELPALQGIVGGHYARLDGLPEPVCWAIETHYESTKNLTDKTLPTSIAGLAVLVADQADKLAGYLGVGLSPSGSSDPFALRRAATVLIELSWQWPALCGIEHLLALCNAEYAKQGIENDSAQAKRLLIEVFNSRYAALLSETRHDILSAALSDFDPAFVLQPRAVRSRVAALEIAVKVPKLIQTATRPSNIVADATRKGFAFGTEDPLAQVHDPHLNSVEGIALKGALGEQEAALAVAVRSGDATTVASLLTKLVQPVSAFFESTMIMVEEEEVRFARLTLAEAVNRQFRVLGDVTKVVQS